MSLVRYPQAAAAWLVVLVTMILLAGCAVPLAAPASQRQVTDMSGRQVKLPDKVSKVACLPGPSYEMMFALGGKNQIGFARPDHKQAYPLAKLTNPELQKYSSQITQVGPKTQINVEEFINAGPDLVLYYAIPEALAQLEAAGIPVITVAFGAVPTKLDDLLADNKNRVRPVAEALGGNALQRYKTWEAYYTEKTNMVRSRTSAVPVEKRPKVYVGNSWGPNPLATWGKDSGLEFTIELAGGVFVARELGLTGFPEVNMEQVIKWSPEVIFIDNHGREPDKVISDIKKDPGWAVLPAIKSGKVHRMPSGVFFLDKGTAVPLFVQWAAKTLHPDLFQDVDLVKEVKYFFKEFYEFDLTTEQAQKVLSGWND